MKKQLLLIPTIATLCLCFCSCNTDNSNYKNSQINNKIMSREGCIAEMKELLQVDTLYYFDCDFSTMPNIQIVDSSYNISVWGQYIYDNELERQVIDFSKQASVEIVANYKIVSDSTCFGFSVVSEVMSTGTKHYKNDVLEYETQNEIYTANTFKSFADLQGENGNGTIYGTNTTVTNIKVPKNFYPMSLSNSLNPISYYRKYSGSLYDIRVDYSPINVVTHYEDYDAFKADDFSMMKKINSFMAQNAIYRKV